jgi:hypothetical protein
MISNRFCLIVALATALGGCGGGGSGSGSGTPITTPVAPPAVSGLVPAAPTIGATLYADAASLRVLRAGALWRYHGVEKPAGELATDFNSYTNTVTQDASGSGVTESATHMYNEAAGSEPIRYEGGAYIATNKIGYAGDILVQDVDVIELRSPVRINDQFVGIDKHIADIRTDLDGDKVNEALDVAVYSTVIGEEILDLPNRRQVKAVHVDLRFRARVKYSKTATFSPVHESLQSTWYAPGIGIVKLRQEEPNNTASLPNRVVTELLENWDGLTEGLGHAATVVATAPAGSSLSGPPLQYVGDVVGFDTSAVAIGQIPDQPSNEGLAVAQLDARGKVVAARTYARTDLFPGTDFFWEPHAIRVGNEVRIFAHTGNQQLSMVGLDASGQRIVRPAVQVVNDAQMGNDNDRTSYRVASDGTGVWIGWLRATWDGQTSNRWLVAQHIDANGVALGPVRTATSPASFDMSRLNMALDGSRLAFSWYASNLQPSWRLAMIDTGTGAGVTDQVLGITFENCRFLNTVALQQGLAMTCSDLSGIAAVRLDANGKPVLLPGATLETSKLQAPWLLPTRGHAGVYGGASGQLIASVLQDGQFWPEGRSDLSFTTLFETAGTGPLAASEPLLLARIAPAVVVQTLVRIGNRVLVVGADSAGNMNTTVVWLPN